MRGVGASTVVVFLRNFYKGKTKGKGVKGNEGAEIWGRRRTTQALLDPHMLEVGGLKS